LCAGYHFWSLVLDQYSLFLPVIISRYHPDLCTYPDAYALSTPVSWASWCLAHCGDSTVDGERINGLWLEPLFSPGSHSFCFYCHWRRYGVELVWFPIARHRAGCTRGCVRRHECCRDCRGRASQYCVDQHI